MRVEEGNEGLARSREFEPLMENSLQGMGYELGFKGLSKRVAIVFILLCTSLVFQSLISQGVTGIISIELEKRYGYPTLYSGIIMAGNEIMPFLFGPMIAFYGSRGFRLKWISIGIMIVGIGAILFSLPQFLFPDYKPTMSTDLKLEAQVCGSNPAFVCDISTSKNETFTSFVALVLFIISQLTMGAGAIPIYVLGPTYIDDHVPKRYFPYFYGVWNLCWIGGPLIGMIIGSAALQLWIDHPKKPLVLITDPRWLGAWWIPYLIIGSLLILIGMILLMLCFTLTNAFKAIPSIQLQQEIDNGSQRSLHVNGGVMTNIFAVMKNRMFIYTTMGHALRMFLITGQTAFLPKILAEVFNQPPTKSGFLIALVVGVSGTISVLVTSRLIKCLEDKSLLRILFLMCAFTSLYTSVHSSTIMAPIGCLTPTILGINQMENNSIIDKNKFCNSHCSCDEIYEPVCGSDGVTYFSSCYAGCSNVTTKVTKSGHSYNIFGECACVKSNNGTNGTATVGSCVSSCPHFYTFVILIALFSFFAFSAAYSNNFILLRYSSEENRSLSISLQSVIIKVLCFIPSPMIFGKAIDRTCIAWSPAAKTINDSGCIEIGNLLCRNYSIESLKRFIAFIGLVCGISSFISYIIGFLYANHRDVNKN